MEVPRRGEEPEDIFSTAFGIFEVGDCCEVGEGDLFEEAGLGGVLVEREQVGAKDEVEGFPLLGYPARSAGGCSGR